MLDQHGKTDTEPEHSLTCPVYLDTDQSITHRKEIPQSSNMSLPQKYADIGVATISEVREFSRCLPIFNR